MPIDQEAGRLARRPERRLELVDPLDLLGQVERALTDPDQGDVLGGDHRASVVGARSGVEREATPPRDEQRERPMVLCRRAEARCRVVVRLDPADQRIVDRHSERAYRSRAIQQERRKICVTQTRPLRLA